MTRAEILAHNAGVEAVAAIAAAAADTLRARLTKAPTRLAFAVAALDGIVEAAADLTLPLPASAAAARSPAPIADGAAPADGGA